MCECFESARCCVCVCTLCKCALYVRVRSMCVYVCVCACACWCGVGVSLSLCHKSIANVMDKDQNTSFCCIVECYILYLNVANLKTCSNVTHSFMQTAHTHIHAHTHTHTYTQHICKRNMYLYSPYVFVANKINLHYIN